MVHANCKVIEVKVIKFFFCLADCPAKVLKKLAPIVHVRQKRNLEFNNFYLQRIDKKKLDFFSQKQNMSLSKV